MNRFTLAILLFAASLWAAAMLDAWTAIVLLAAGWAVVLIAVRAAMKGDAP